MSVYLDKKTNRYYISHRVNQKQKVMRRDLNGNPFKTRKEAILFEEKYFSNLNNSFYENQNKTFKQLEKVIIQRLGMYYKVTTLHSIKETYTKYFLAFFGNTKLKNLTYESLLEYRRYLVERCGEFTSIKSVEANSKAILKIINELFNTNINEKVLAIRNKKQKVTKLNYYTYDEFNKYLAVIKDDNDKLIFLLLYYYGLRIGELRALGSSSFDLANNLLIIERAVTDHVGMKKAIVIEPKNKSSVRSYPLLNDIKILYIKIYGENFKGDFILSKNPNKPIGGTTICRKNFKYSKEAGLQHIRIHDFRHSCAIYLYSNNFNSASIAKWLGHSSTQTTERTYIHYRDDVKDKIKEFIEKNQVLKD